MSQRTPTGTISERLYRLLLLAYPRAFREEYAAEMFLAFRDAYREASRRWGTLGIVRLWGDVAWDLVKTICIEHFHDWMQRGGLAPAGKERFAMTLPYKLDVAQRTDIGRERADNEDNLVAVVPEDKDLLRTRGALFVVSDGMGGHARGDVASELAVQQVKDAYYQGGQDDIPAALREAIERANLAIVRENEAEKARGAGDFHMGATCVAVVLRDQTLYSANVGDSRVYVLREGHLRQITRDHSVVARMVERGEITPAEARTHEQRNVIYRALGQPDVAIDLFTEPVAEGDTLILCTDGLSSVLGDDEVRAIVERYGPEESVERLIARANEEGGPDNVTAIVVRVSAA